MGTRSESRLGYASLSKSPSSALYTDWFLQTILFRISKDVCNRFMSSFSNLQKYAILQSGKLTRGGNFRYISGFRNSSN